MPIPLFVGYVLFIKLRYKSCSTGVETNLGLLE